MSVFNVGILADFRNLRDQCAGPDCRISRLKRPRVGRKTGIRLGDSWFCSDECFRQAVQIRIRQLQEIASRKLPQRNSRLPLGLLLLSRGCITNAQLDLALEQQRRLGGRLGEILCDLHFATETEVAAAAATQWGCPVFRPKSSPREVQARIPAALMTLYWMAPVHYSASSNKLFVGFAHRIEHHVLHTIEDITSCVTQPCVITSSQCRVTIQNLPSQGNDVTFDRISSAAEMARIVQSYASQIGADEVRLGVCRDYVWARLNRGDYSTDLLFTLCDEPAKEYEFAGN